MMRALILVIVVAGGAVAADLTFTGGVFRFYATDHYYPIFFDEVGARGEVAFAVGDVNRSTVRLVVAAYPMDDNILDPAVEYAYSRKLTIGGWGFQLEPAAGFEYTKLQYPAPYFPEPEHHFLPWVRGGVDAGVGHRFWGGSYLHVVYRIRALYYVGSWHEAFKADTGEPFQIIHAPYFEFSYPLGPAWVARGRGGWEFGGFLDEIFIREKSRPYVEVGATYLLP
jgi:hypothetical protein